MSLYHFALCYFGTGLTLVALALYGTKREEIVRLAKGFPTATPFNVMLCGMFLWPLLTLRAVSRKPFLGFLLLLSLLAVFTTVAKSHDWYEQSCCSGQDCAPVADDVVSNRQDGVHVKGYGYLSYGDPRLRWSRDNRDHLCVTRDGMSGAHKLRCVYRKFNGI